MVPIWLIIPAGIVGILSGKLKKIIGILARNTLDTNSICEVGCGAGGVLYELSSQFSEKEFCGYEISPQAYELCARRDQRENLSFFIFPWIYRIKSCCEAILCCAAGRDLAIFIISPRTGKQRWSGIPSSFVIS